MLQKGNTADVMARNLELLMACGHPPTQAANIAASYSQGVDSAAGVVFHCGGMVLLLLRRDGDCDYPLTWALPAGGIEEGETPEQAAIRECSEELGMTPENLAFIDWSDGFTTFASEVSDRFVPVLNHEHLGYCWAPLSVLPSPMHPGCALTLGRITLVTTAAAQIAAMDTRVVDGNGWFEVIDNPISKAGIFPYSGHQLGITGADADRIFQVLRPPEELSDPECIESFKLIPWVDDHTMIGPNAVDEIPGSAHAEVKGVQGVIGENVRFDTASNMLVANLKGFSSTLTQLIAAGKRELSAGYRCIYDMVAGEWNGQQYDAVQRKIRGNHLALVAEGRMGPDVAVMDRLNFSLDAKEAIMAGETKAEPAAAGGGDMTLSEITAALKQILPQIAEMNKALAGLNSPAPVAPAAELDAKPDMDPDDAGEGTPAGSAADKEPAVAASMDEATFFKRLGQRDALAQQLSTVLGTFDHRTMSLEQVVGYGCDKLALNADKGTEAATLAGYLKAASKQLPARVVAQDHANGPAAGSFMAKYLQPKEA